MVQTHGKLVFKKQENDKHTVMLAITPGSERVVTGVSVVVIMHFLMWVGRHVDIHFTAKCYNSHLLRICKQCNILFKGASMKKNKTTPLLGQAIFLGWHPHARPWQGKFKVAQFPTPSPPPPQRPTCPLPGFLLRAVQSAPASRALCLQWHFCLFVFLM